MTEPRAVVPASIMPAYPWLAERAANASGDIQARMRALETLGIRTPTRSSTRPRPRSRARRSSTR